MNIFRSFAVVFFTLLCGVPLLARELNCVGFGSINFLKVENEEKIKKCLVQVSDEEFFKIHSNGNNLPMNAVVAGVEAKLLSSILSNYQSEDLEAALKHRNFEDLSIAHLGAVSENGARLLIELSSWGTDLNMLKDKQDGTLLSADRGWSALHYAIDRKSSFENILALLSTGIDVNLLDKNGNSALNFVVSKEQRYDVISLILSWTDDYTQNDKGYGALHFASQKVTDADNLKLIFQMIDEGYHDDVTSNDETVLHLSAAAAKSPEVFEVILAISEDFKCDKDKKDAQAIDYARKNPNISSSKQVLDLQNSCD
jgi:ankyrin repeat protein